MFEETKKILDILCIPSHDEEKYLLLQGDDNKIWILPYKAIKQGLQMYQPGSAKGKLLKKMLPYCMWLSPLLRIFHMTSIHLEISFPIRKVLSILAEVPTEKLTYALYLGDTRFVENRKAVMQIAYCQRILAYGKFTEENTVADAFKRETKMLEWLSEHGIVHIPKVLWQGDVQGLYGFVQSTEKTGQEPFVGQLTKKHWSFLQEVNDKTQHVVDFEHSDYKKELELYKQAFLNSKWNSKELICDVIQQIEDYYVSHAFKTSFFHGDFTPWNICYEQDHIFVFDFEYAKKDFPEWLDAFHFITQVGIMTKEMDGDTIYKSFEKQKEMFKQYMENPKMTYLCYLVHILGFYYVRWEGKLAEEERSCSVWLKVLQKCYEGLNRKENE